MIRCRGALIAVLVAAFMAPTALGASTTTFKGAVSDDENSRVAFEVVKNDRGRRRVDVPRGKLLDATCDKGQEEINVRFGSGLKSARVGADGAFDFDNSGKTYVAYVRGTITGKSATGVLRYQGETGFPDGVQNCDTGEVEWTAKKI